MVLTDVNEKAAAAGTADKIAEVTKALEDGSLHVFDTSTFTVEGKPVTSFMADVDTDAAYTPRHRGREGRLHPRVRVPLRTLLHPAD